MQHADPFRKITGKIFAFQFASRAMCSKFSMKRQVLVAVVTESWLHPRPPRQRQTHREVGKQSYGSQLRRGGCSLGRQATEGMDGTRK